MAIQQTKKQSDLEKRLTVLRQQIYGRNSELENSASQGTRKSEHQTFTLPGETFRSDAVYLRGDLIKISITAGSALGLQIILYFLIKNNVLNINLF